LRHTAQYICCSATWAKASGNFPIQQLTEGYSTPTQSPSKISSRKLQEPRCKIHQCVTYVRYTYWNITKTHFTLQVLEGNRLCMAETRHRETWRSFSERRAYSASCPELL